MIKNKFYILAAVFFTFLAFSLSVSAQAPLPPNQRTPINTNGQLISDEPLLKTQENTINSNGEAAKAASGHPAAAKNDRAGDFKRYYSRDDLVKWGPALNEASEKLILRYRQWQTDSSASSDLEQWVLAMFNEVDNKSGNLINKRPNLSEKEIFNQEKLWLRALLDKEIGSLAFDGNAYYVIMRTHNTEDSGPWLPMPLPRQGFAVSFNEEEELTEDEDVQLRGHADIQAPRSSAVKKDDDITRYEMMQKAWQVQSDKDKPRRSGR